MYALGKINTIEYIGLWTLLLQPIEENTFKQLVWPGPLIILLLLEINNDS